MFKRFYLDLNLGMNLSSLHDRKVYLQITGEKFETKIITEDTAKNCTNTIAKTVLNHNPAALSHFCDVPSNIISKRNVTEIQIVGEPEEGANGLPPLYGMHSYIPEQVRRNLVKRGYKRMRKTGTSVHELATQTHPKLKAYFDIGIIPKAVSLENVATHVVETDLLISPYDTAVSLLSKHPELASSKAYTAGVAQEHIVGIDDPQQQQRVLDLATSISKQGPATKTGGWAVIRQAVETDADGQEQPMFADYTLKDDQGGVVFTEGEAMMYYDLSADTESYASSPVSHAVASGRNDTRLEGQTWAQPQGIAANQTNFSRKETKELNALARTQKMGPDAADRAKLFTVSEKTPNHGLAVFPDSVKYNPDENLFSMEVRNEYLRQLGSYVEFYSDTQMEQPIESPEINGQWPFYFPDGLRQLFETNTERAIGTVPAINTIMGIPMPTDPTNLEVPWPKEAQAARLMFGGLGTSNWISPVVWPGVILTGMFNIGLPIAFMIAGAALTNTQWYKDFVSSRDNVMAVIGVAFPIVGAGVATGAALGNTKKVLFSFANTFIGMLAKKGFEKLASYVMKKVAASAIKNALPIVGFAFRLASIAMSGAQLAVTIGEILSTPAVLEVDVLRQMELDFTLHPDPEHGEPGRPETAIWPLVGEQVQVTVTYVNGTSYVQNQTLPKTSTNDPLIFRFKPIGWGGKFTVTANVYSRNGWLCGKYVSKELDAEPDSKTPGVKAISGTIKEQLVPLTGDTQYYYKQSLEFDGSKHLWAAGKVSTATLSDLNCSNADHYLCELVSMTVNQKAYQAGYVFRASGQGIPNENSKGKPDNGQIYAIQNISLLSTETLNERLKFSEEGFLVKPGIAYDTFGVGPSADKISPLNFILDSRGGTYRLRHVDLMNFKHDFGLTKPQRKSWGQFLIPDIDELAIHPSGLAIAISYQASKMQILQLPPEPLPDGQEPQAQIVSGYGVLQGLMRGPIAAKVSVDGAIYILESIGRRIQAFDTKGNPVPTFQGASLFTMEGPGFAASLNDEKFSPEIRDVFMSKGVGHLFDFRDPSFAAILNQGKLTMDVVNTMAAHGIYLSFNEDANGIIPEGSTTVTVDEPDVMWTLHDPQKNFTYEIKTINGQTDEFSVSDLLSNVTVDAIGRDTRWVVNDLAGTQSFLLLGVPDTPLIKVYEYLSYFDLKGDDSTRYVDFALEAKGYIYVLSYQNDGGARVPHTAYSLDIHKPNGEFLVRTPDPKLHADPEKMEFVAAARLVLDPFRNVFTLDYSSFQGPNGRTEPGVSTWIPTTPLFDDEPAKMLLFETKDIPGLVHLFKKHGVTISPDSTVEIVNPDGDFLLHSGGDTYNAIISLDTSGAQRLFVYDIIA